MGDLAIVLRRPPGDEGRIELGIAGHLTHATAAALRDHLRRLLDTTSEPSPWILLDISCCISIDVDGMRALAAAQDDARARGGEVHLVHTPPLIAHQVRVHHFERLMPAPDAHWA